MSNEITWTGNFSCKNGSYSDKWSISNSQITQNAVGASAGVLPCTTSAANIPYASVSSVGFLLLENLEAAGGHSVDFGIVVDATFQPVGTLQPGENTIFRVKASTQIQLKATGAANVQYWLLSN